MTGGGKSCVVCKLVGLLVALGAINWGAVGIAQVNLVEKLLGDMTTASRVVYVLIGLAGVMKLVSLFVCCPCNKGSCETKK